MNCIFKISRILSNKLISQRVCLCQKESYATYMASRYVLNPQSKKLQMLEYPLPNEIYRKPQSLEDGAESSINLRLRQLVDNESNYNALRRAVATVSKRNTSLSIIQLKYLANVYIVCVIDNSCNIVALQRHLAPVLRKFSASCCNHSGSLFIDIAILEAFMARQHLVGCKNIYDMLVYDGQKAGAQFLRIAKLNRGTLEFQTSSSEVEMVKQNLIRAGYMPMSVEFHFQARELVELTIAQMRTYKRMLESLLAVPGIIYVFDNLLCSVLEDEVQDNDAKELHKV